MKRGGGRKLVRGVVKERGGERRRLEDGMRSDGGECGDSRRPEVGERSKGGVHGQRRGRGWNLVGGVWKERLQRGGGRRLVGGAG